jgi:DnaJ-class molecular chaperone
VDGTRSPSKDYYYILGVSREATSEEIQEAYQDLYNKFGPHVNVGGQDPEAMIKAMRDIAEAYEMLSDPQRRAEYDKVHLPHMEKHDLRALWGKLTGTDPNKEPETKGAPEDYLVKQEITLRDAIKGTKCRVRIDEQLPCKNCQALKPVQRLQCQSCRGAGSMHNPRQEEIEIYPGQYDKAQLRLPNLGKWDARAGKRGDLVIEIRIRPHQFFTVIGRDLACTVPITILEAILGGEIEIPTATGKVFMKIQPLTQSGRVYRLKGMGLAGADLLATMDIVVPSQISVEELDLYRKLKNVSTIRNPREEILANLANQAAQQTNTAE